MLIFVTGAGGFIGRAVVEELIKHGHEVLGLSRSDKSSELLTKLGAQVQKGSLDDHESLKSGAKAADGVIHLAFDLDFSNFKKSSEKDQAAIQTMADVLGEGKPLVIASGTMACVKGSPAAEDDEPERGTPFAMRTDSADLVMKLSKEKGILGASMRLAPTVHGQEDGGLIPMFGGIAQKLGFVPLIGDGGNRWPAIHRHDAAVLFRLAVEKGKPGATYHAASEGGVTMKEITDVIGKKLNLPVKSMSMEEAMPNLGFLAMVFSADNPISTEITQKALGWDPSESNQPKLLADLEANYFE